MQTPLQHREEKPTSTSRIEENLLNTSVGWINLRRVTSEHPTELLERILKDSIIALYPRTLTIGDCPHDQDEVNFDRDGGILKSDNYRLKSGYPLGHNVHGVVERFCYHTPRCIKCCVSVPWDLFTERILAHHKGPTAALLLILLNNLEVVDFESFWRSPMPFLKIISEIIGLSCENPRYVFLEIHLCQPFMGLKPPYEVTCFGCATR